MNAQEYEWNPPERLPPVGCPLVIRVGNSALRCERTGHLQDKAGEMEYRSLATGQLWRGRFMWSYPYL